MLGLGLFLLALGFYVGGKEAKTTNKELENGEKTRYELLWYVFSVSFVVTGIWYISMDVI